VFRLPRGGGLIRSSQRGGKRSPSLLIMKSGKKKEYVPFHPPFISWGGEGGKKRRGRDPFSQKKKDPLHISLSSSFQSGGKKKRKGSLHLPPGQRGRGEEFEKPSKGKRVQEKKVESQEKRTPEPLPFPFLLDKREGKKPFQFFHSRGGGGRTRTLFLSSLLLRGDRFITIILFKKRGGTTP